MLQSEGCKLSLEFGTILMKKAPGEMCDWRGQISRDSDE